MKKEIKIYPPEDYWDNIAEAVNPPLIALMIVVGGFILYLIVGALFFNN